jgi:hypothetical protein
MTEQFAAAALAVHDAGPRPGDRVQVEARGHVMASRDRAGIREYLVHLRTVGGDQRADVWLPVEMLVLLDRRTSS